MKITDYSRVLVVDDDEDMRETIRDEIECQHPKCVLKLSETLIDWSCDLLLIDMSAVGGRNDVTRAYRPIIQWHERHPGADIVIASAHDNEVLQPLIDGLVEIGVRVMSARKGGGFMSALFP